MFLDINDGDNVFTAILKGLLTLCIIISFCILLDYYC